jgi:ribosome-binding protein aMBF1 (putative translation factor)
MPQHHTFTESNIDGLFFSTGSPIRMLHIVRFEADPFRKHVESLPTLSELVADARRVDPEFDTHYATAGEELYQGALAAVQSGELSRITAERVRLGLTQAELAERAGMLQPNISRLEKPGAPIAVSTAKKLAGVLGLDDYKVLLP